MTTPTPAVPLPQQIAELKRELALRKNVYPRQISAEKMTQAQADHCTAAMTAALHTVMAVKRLRATMAEHFLMTPFGEGTQRAHCACGWTSCAASDRAASIDEHIDHVFERSKAAAEAEAT